MVRNQASVTLNITKCTTIGPPRIGKTCLKHFLTGQEWDVEAGTASTDVMEAPEWVECYSLEEGGADKPWKLLSAEQQQGELIRAVNTLTTSSTELTTTPSDAPPATKANNVPLTIKASDAPPTTTASDGLPTTTTSDGPPTITTSDAPSTTTTNDAPSTTTTSDGPPTITASDGPPTTTASVALPTTTDATRSPATVQQALEALASACSHEALQGYLKDKKGKVLGERRLVHFIDTGGQAIYHDVHPVLITSPSVYLVVFNLKELYEKKSRNEQLKYFRSDLIQRPLRSIYTFGMKTFHKKDSVVLHSEAPKILIVGTHLDQIPVVDSDVTQEGFLDEISKMIVQEIGNKPYRQFVQFDTKDRPFWAVDNTKAGKEQDEDAKEYSSALRMMVQEGSTEMSVKVPLPWLLLQLVMEGQQVRYCTYSELLKVACDRGYVSEQSPCTDLDTLLWLFHILGLFYHNVPKGYKKEDSLVFIDPDCLYSATSDFLMAAKEEIKDSSKDQHQNQAATKEEAEDSQRSSKEGQHQTQAVTKEEVEDSQGGSEERQHQTQAATMEETEDSQRGSKVGEHQTKATTVEETEDSQGGSKVGEHQTKATTVEETEDNQGGSEVGQHQTKATTMEETEDSQGGSEERQHQTQAATMEETEDSQRGSKVGEHQTKATTVEETEDNQGGSEVGQHQTKATTMEETEDSQGGSEERQHQTQAASKDETEDSQVEDMGDQLGTQAAIMGGMGQYEVMGGKGSQRKQKVKKGIVQKKKVFERIQRNSDSIQREMAAVLQIVENAMAQEATDDVLESLHAHLKDKEQEYKLPPQEGQTASSVEAKRQLFIGRLVHSLARSVKAVLRDSERKGDSHHVRREVDKAVKIIKARYVSRSIDSRDMDQFLSILSSLRIVAQLSDSDSYVIPAALPEMQHTVEIAGNADPILVTVVSQTIMQVCYLPSGLFCCLISELVTKADWTVHPHGRTHVAFTHEGFIGWAHVMEHKSYIEIKLESQASLQELAQTCPTVKRSIQEGIVNVYKNLYSDPTADATFEESLVWGFQCKAHPGDDTHIAAFEEDNNEYCAECLLSASSALQPVTEAQLVWGLTATQL